MKMTNKRLFFLAIFCCIAMAGPVVHAGDDDHHDSTSREGGDGQGGRPQAGDRPAPNSPGPVSLEREMKAMSRAYKTIRSQVKDPIKNPTTLAAVLNLEQHTVASKSVTPYVATTQPTDAKIAAKKAEFEFEMITLLRGELDLEEALLSNDNAKAIKAAADLHNLEEQGHREFRPRDDE